MRRSGLTETELQPRLAPNVAHDLAPLSGPSRRPIHNARSANDMTAPARLSGSADVSSLHACYVRLQLSWWQNTQQTLKKQRQRDPDDVQRLIKTVRNHQNQHLGWVFSISRCCLEIVRHGSMI